MENILTLDKAAKILGLKERTLAEKVRAGEIPAYRKFGKWYILEIELIEFIKEGERKYKNKDKYISEALLNRTKMANKGKESVVVRSVLNNPTIADFITSDDYESIAQTVEKFGVSYGQIKKIRRGLIELGRLEKRN